MSRHPVAAAWWPVVINMRTMHACRIAHHRGHCALHSYSIGEHRGGVWGALEGGMHVHGHTHSHAAGRGCRAHASQPGERRAVRAHARACALHSYSIGEHRGGVWGALEGGMHVHVHTHRPTAACHTHSQALACPHSLPPGSCLTLSPPAALQQPPAAVQGEWWGGQLLCRAGGQAWRTWVFFLSIAASRPGAPHRARNMAACPANQHTHTPYQPAARARSAGQAAKQLRAGTRGKGQPSSR